jgi:hypothetical protein
MYINRMLLLALVILYAFAPMMADWIDASDTQWYRSHLLWLGVIAGVSLAMYRDSRDES